MDTTSVVFTTIELLEAILLRLDPTSVLHTLGVNSTFKPTIERSSAIQHRLLLNLVLDRKIRLDNLGSYLYVSTTEGREKRSGCQKDTTGTVVAEEEKSVRLVIAVVLHMDLWVIINAYAGGRKGEDRVYLRGSWEDFAVTLPKEYKVRVVFSNTWGSGAMCQAEKRWQGMVRADQRLGEVVGEMMRR